MSEGVFVLADIFIGDTYDSQYYDAVVTQTDKGRLKTRTQEWMSRPRESASSVVEILTYEFADRAPISSIAFDVLSVGAEYEVWYYDSAGTRLPLLRDDYNQIHFVVESEEDWTRWQHWEFQCMACVATKLELRMRRIDDDLAPDNEYSLGVRKMAIKRQINTRVDAALPLQDTTDILGNIVSKAVYDWDARFMTDGEDNTFWKCEPQISQDAVVCLYLDIRDKYGEPQYFDSINIDPVYAGSQMNVYYSNDATMGDRVPSHSSYPATYSGCEYTTDSATGWRDAENPLISTDLTATEMDLDGSWMIGVSWLPMSQPSGTTTIASIGKNFRLDLNADDGRFEFWYQHDGGLDHIDVDMPCDVKYRRGLPQVDNVDSEIRVEFGVDRGDDELLHVRVRMLNWYTTTGELIDPTTDDKPTHEAGEIIDDETVVKTVRTAMQISAIVDGVKGGDVSGASVRTLSDGVDSSTELVVAAHSSVEIPLSIPEDIDPVSGGYDIDVELNYRTDDAYLGGGELVIANGDEIESGYTSWWYGTQGESPSRMNIGTDGQVTNWFQNPEFSASGSWQPDETTGNGTATLTGDSLRLNGIIRARNVEALPYQVPGGRYYVFSAVPEFSGVNSLYKDYSLFVYDGRSETYVAFADGMPASGGRVELRFFMPDDPSLISLGFVGGSESGDVVTWRDPMLCEADDWATLENHGVDYFSGDTYRRTGDVLERYSQELNPNPRNREDLPLIGEVVHPSFCQKRSFNSDIVKINPYLNTYDIPQIDWWMPAKGGSSFTFSFWCISRKAWSQLQPVMLDTKGNMYWPDRYQYSEGEGGWRLVYARVSIPSDHEPDMMTFGIYERATDAFSYLGEMHVYDNSAAFEEPEPYTVSSASRRFSASMSAGSLSGLKVLVRNSDANPIYVESCSVRAVARRVSDLPDATASFSWTHGTLRNVVVKQEGLPDEDRDRFLQNPDIYTSPDSYDVSSTLFNALLYGRFSYEWTLRGGVADSAFDAKVWTPILTGATLERTRYTMPTPTQARFVKLEFSQLTPQQYPIESPYISSTYRVFPVEQTREMLQRANADETVRNGRQTVDSYYGNTLTARQSAYYASTDLGNPTRSGDRRSLYDNPDAEVLTSSDTGDYDARLSGTSIADATRTETTSSTLLNTVGTSTAVASSGAGLSRLSTAAQENARYMIYTAQASETLIAIARRYDLADWRLIRQIDGYVDDKSDRTAISGRVPGYWVLPGQQLLIPVGQVRQVTGTSKIDTIDRVATKQPLTSIVDIRTPIPTLSTNGPKYFSQTSVHSYEYRTEKRTQSIAYFVAIRELSVDIVDYLQERDNVSWNFYSMAMPVWHLDGGYLTTQEVFVPDLSTGRGVAVAETDVMHSQSYYRTCKYISVNRDSLMNRTYFSFEGEAWHGPEYWDQHPELNCVWDDSTPDNPDVYEDNGGAWNSRRFAWGDTWSGTVIPGHTDDVWYDGELVKHIVVNPEDRVFDADGNQQPYVYHLGEIYVPSNSLAVLGASLFSLKTANPNRPDHHLETRLQLVSGRWSNDPMIDEVVGFDDTKVGTWQNVTTSRHHLLDMQYKCDVYLYFNDFERLDLYAKSMYLELGTMRILQKNNVNLDWEDITSAVGRADSEYTFRTTGHDLQLRVEMYDPQDWFSQIIVVPIYIPQEDAVNYSSDFIHELELVQADSAGSAIPVSGRQGAQYALAVRATYGDGTSSGVITDGVSYSTSDPDVLLVRDMSGRKTLLFAGPGDATVTATYKGATSSPISIHVTQ